MDFRDATQKADQILYEERQQPTVEYEFVSLNNAALIPSALATLGTLLGPEAIAKGRGKHPRPIFEKSFFKFKSANFDLLSILFSQVNEKERSSFLLHLWSRMTNPCCCRRIGYTTFLNWRNIVSELPLITEFSLRRGDRSSFFRYLAETLILTPGLLLVLMQIEELLSVNFNILGDMDIEQLSGGLTGIRLLAERKQNDTGEITVIDAKTKEYLATSKIAAEMILICDGIAEQCRKIRYLYLKGALLQEANFEVNQDKAAVESYLQNLGFNKNLIESLNHAEELYRSPSPFELKSCMGHLRSFLENLYAEAAGRVARHAKVQIPSKWGAYILCLRQNDIMSEAEEQFLVSLYKLISDQAVHPLSVDREYARIARNVVIEYGLVLLSRMDKAGLGP